MMPRMMVALLLALPVTRLAAQSPTALLGLGIQAYRDVDMVGSVQHLRRALAAGGDEALEVDAHKQALTYLGAAELYRDRRDSATAAFRRLVDLDPRYRPDPVVFPGHVRRARPRPAAGAVCQRPPHGRGDRRDGVGRSGGHDSQRTGR
jgi:hypothetical protein